MTRQEAEATLRAAYPDRSICLTMTRWSHEHVKHKDWTTGFQVSVLPGNEAGQKCDQYYAANLSEAVRLALAGKDTNRPATVEQVEQFLEPVAAPF